MNKDEFLNAVRWNNVATISQFMSTFAPVQVNVASSAYMMQSLNHVMLKDINRGLVLAAQNGYHEIVSVLLPHADLFDDNGSALIWALRKQKEGMVTGVVALFCPYVSNTSLPEKVSIQITLLGLRETFEQEMAAYQNRMLLDQVKDIDAPSRPKKM